MEQFLRSRFGIIASGSALQNFRTNHLAILVVVALVARASSFGDPNYHVDETFYLLVGEAMHSGLMPYVDIWDRKPPGLFVLYWALAGIGGSVLSFQIAGFLFAVATGAVVSRIARRWCDANAALLAGCLYIAYLQPLLGGGGQSPVFYNLFICCGMLLLVQAIEQPAKSGILFRGVIAAALAGLAVSIKPTAVFEGGAIVLGFCWAEWHRRQSYSAAVRMLTAIAPAAALPVAAMLIWYGASDHFAEFWQATVVSNFDKERAPPLVFTSAVLQAIMITSPIVVCAFLGLTTARDFGADRTVRAMVSAWLIAALAGFLAVPNFYSHYALPVVPVLCVLCAHYFSSRTFGPYLGIGLIAWCLIAGQSFDLTRGLRSKGRFDQAVKVIQANRGNGVLYVFDGAPYLYSASNMRWASRFVFPEHLNNSIEQNALGVDAEGEMRRVLAKKPDVITFTNSPKPTLNTTNWKLLQTSLTQSYHFVCAMPAFDIEHHYEIFIFSKSPHPDRSHCKRTV
jgi:hypothetical protein